MWKQILSAIHRLFVMDEIVTRHEREINDLRLAARQNSASLEELRALLKSNVDNERHEREKICLRLENALLNFERRIPSPPVLKRKRQK